MNTQVEVTQARLDAGTPKDPRWCALALAIADATVGRFESSVFAEGALVLDPLPLPATDESRLARRRTLPLPSPALNLMWRYDRGMPVTPLTFSIDLPDVSAATREIGRPRGQE